MTGNVTQLIIDAVDLAGGASVDAPTALVLYLAIDTRRWANP